jgi:hypothetical protein
MSRIDKMASEVIKWFEEDAATNPNVITEFVGCKKEDLTQFHSGLGTYIRNYFRLWDAQWTPDITDGVDYSPDHPDAVSMAVIEEVWTRLQHTEYRTMHKLSS